jgi:hypothetical protein
MGRKPPEFDETQMSITYRASPTSRRFHASKAKVRGLMGPVGGGKTVACIMELYTRALEQEPFEGVRRSRFALIRQTYPMLLSTTLKTFESWIPPYVCPVTRAVPISGMLKVNLPDGTRVEAEFLFLALDDTDVNKLKSLEVTGAFLNEASEISKDVLDVLTTRIGRYPQVIRGGPTWHGLVMDTNPPDDGHWWYRLAEVEQPKGYEFFRQPPAVLLVPGKTDSEAPHYEPNDGSRGVPGAENIAFLPGATKANPLGGWEYYMSLIQGKSAEWIKVYVQGEYGSIMSGKPVYPEYSDSVHLAKEELLPYGGLPVILGFDFGLTPACIIAQQSPRGQLRVLDELVSDNMGVERFARDVVKPFLARPKYQKCSFHGVGDPAGAARAQSDETTCFQLLENEGIFASPAPSNSFQIRREAVAWFLSKMVDGAPGMLLSPTCKVLRKGFLGDYHYRKLKISSGERFAETPEKNDASHPHDGLQYICSFLRAQTAASADFTFGGTHVRREIKVKDPRGWT